VAVASAEPYADLHLDPDTTMPAPHHLDFSLMTLESHATDRHRFDVFWFCESLFVTRL